MHFNALFFLSPYLCISYEKGNILLIVRPPQSTIRNKKKTSENEMKYVYCFREQENILYNESNMLKL